MLHDQLYSACLPWKVQNFDTQVRHGNLNLLTDASARPRHQGQGRRVSKSTWSYAA